MGDTVESLRAELATTNAELEKARAQRDGYLRQLQERDRYRFGPGEYARRCNCEPRRPSGECFWKLLYQGADQSHQAFVDAVRSALAITAEPTP